MVIQKKLLILGLILFCLSCKDEQLVFDKKVNDIIDSYIQENPLKLPIEKNLYKNGFSYPSYHVYFEKENTDTVLKIVQLPHLTDIKLDGYVSGKEKDTYIHDNIEVKGFYMYKGKFPIVILDEDSIGRKFYDKTKLLIVPDSLKFNRENYHNKASKWNYIIKKGTFEKR